MIGPVIDLVGVGKTYRTGSLSVDALCDVTLSIDRGEFVAITGPSGSGKSTLMPVSYTHLDVYKRQSSWRPTTAT